LIGPPGNNLVDQIGARNAAAMPLRHGAALFPGHQNILCVYLLSHGLIKLLLGGGPSYKSALVLPSLARGASRLYRNQVYRFFYTHSVGLVLLTIFDLFVDPNGLRALGPCDNRDCHHRAVEDAGKQHAELDGSRPYLIARRGDLRTSMAENTT
jgi:hypothetical protein